MSDEARDASAQSPDPKSSSEGEPEAPLLPPPVRRVYAAPPKSKSRDRDSFEDAMRMRLFGWSLVGALVGFGLGVNVVVRGGSIVMLPVLTLVGWGGTIVLPMVLMAGGTKLGSLIYNPTGSSTPRKRDLSYAKSLVARGMFEEAMGAYEEALLEDPTDPTPYLAVARLARDRMDDAERAASWFQKGLLQSEMGSAAALLALREYVELCELRIGEPRRAAPLLARMAAERTGTQVGDWAGETLARIKEQMATGSGGE